MALDDPPTGGDQPARLQPQAAQRRGGLAHQHPLVGTRRPGHISQPLDRVHF